VTQAHNFDFDDLFCPLTTVMNDGHNSSRKIHRDLCIDSLKKEKEKKNKEGKCVVCQLCV